VSETDPVCVDTSGADSPVSFANKPCDGSFDHGPVLAIVLSADAVAPVGSSLGEKLVVFADSEDLASR